MTPLDNNDYYFMNSLSVIHDINSLKLEIDSLRPIDKVQENKIMQKFRLDWNYNSNAIEGNSLDYGETAAFLMQGITAKGKPLKDYLDIKGHNEVIDYLSYLVKNKEELSEKDIRSMHQMLLVEPYESPAQTVEGIFTNKIIRIGEYKRTANHVKTITGEIHYYASPEETPILMGELIEWYRSNITNPKLHPVIIASIFHHRFASIHPFDDGNGRISRLLMNLILMQHDYPPVVIKNADKNDYYLTLSQADAGDPEPFINFIADNLLHSLNLYIRGAKGESIEEQSDLRKKLSLFKKEVEARGDKIEVKKSPEALKNAFEKSILPFLNEISIVLSDFKDLFFDYEEKYVLLNGFPTNKWIYQDAQITSKLENVFHADEQKHIEVVSYQLSNFKLAEDSFSVELKLAFMLDETDYSIFYSFSDVNELDRVTGAMYHQWMDELSVKKYYHQFISSEDVKKLVNKIGEEFYEYNRLIFDKLKLQKSQLQDKNVTNIWGEFLRVYTKIDKNLLETFGAGSSLHVDFDKSVVFIRVPQHIYNLFNIEEKVDIELNFFKLLNRDNQSISKSFVKIIGI